MRIERSLPPVTKNSPRLNKQTHVDKYIDTHTHTHTHTHRERERERERERKSRQPKQSFDNKSSRATLQRTDTSTAAITNLAIAMLHISAAWPSSVSTCSNLKQFGLGLTLGPGSGLSPPALADRQGRGPISVPVFDQPCICIVGREYDISPCICQSIGQRVSVSVSRLVNASVYLSVDWSTRQCICRSIGQRVSVSVGRMVRLG